ncbi:glycoside-pentoside-hexuronide (GPH):cation symporter [Catellatospora sp. KI3]|uniref:glycoside-pentoside-hexuronide (GPH):cation symporter n=1 Tax=Catellatospora sp. KI3 TaxID=3041620 RepID=UPI00248215C5|nr:glycoside-pentoside-hexuronide (GPH):cation symporter [Catellatospora sp. KI3]MDI1464042.1 glycoside-pentoside-hexuronide (GPH):cation symporter [Catellatospora sp. KI3]
MSIGTLAAPPTSWRTKVAYGWGSLGNNIVYGFIATYLAVFYTDHYGLAPGDVALLFFLVRTADALLDPVMGALVDRTRTRWGRFRPYLVFVPPVLAAATVVCVSAPQLGGGGKLVFAYLSYLLWGMAFTAMDVPYWSMSAALSTDAQDRTAIVMVPRTLASVGYIGVNIVTLPLVGLFSGGGELRGWLLVAVVYGAAATALTWLTAASVRERPAPPAQPYGPRTMLRLLGANRPLQLVLAAMLVTELVFAVRSIVPIYYLTYNFDAPGLVPAFIGVFAVATIIGSLASPLLARRFGKRRLAVAGIALTSLTSIAAWFTGYATLGPVLAWTAVGGVGFGLANITLLSMLTDTVEYGQWRTGRRTEGLVFSVNIVKTKIASALGAGLSLAVLGAVGYVANQEQTRAALDGLHLLMTLAPGLGGLLAVAFLVRYPLSEQQHADLVAELRGREAVGGVAELRGREAVGGVAELRGREAAA